MTEIKRSIGNISCNTSLLNKKQQIQDNYISGYASVFDVEDSQKDIIKNTAFRQVIEEFNNGRPIPLLWQHMPDKPIGIIEQLKEDEYGLYIVARILSNIRYGVEALELIKSRIICSFSIGFDVLDQYMDYDRDVRIIENVNLWEISIVTFPANKYSSITSFSDSQI